MDWRESETWILGTGTPSVQGTYYDPFSGHK